MFKITLLLYSQRRSYEWKLRIIMKERMKAEKECKDRNMCVGLSWFVKVETERERRK